MLSIIKRVPWKMCLANSALTTAVNKPIKHNFYTEADLSIEIFVRHSNYVLNNNQSKFSAIKSNIEEALKNPSGRIFTEDLKTFLYMVVTDADLELLIKAVQKYKTQDTMSMYNYTFDVPLMRLLYSKNYTDKALELFLTENSPIIGSMMSCLLVVNKLVEQKRYDSLIPVYEKLKSKYTRIYPKTVLVLLEGLVEKNDAEALKVAKDILLSAKDEILFDLYAKKAFLLAINQNDNEYAYELISKFKNVEEVIVNNFQIMALCRMGRIEEACLLINHMIQRAKSFNRRSIIFSEVFQEIKKASESVNNNEELKNNLNGFVDQLSQMLFKTLFRDSIMRNILIKKPQIQQEGQVSSTNKSGFNRLQDNRNQMNRNTRNDGSDGSSRSYSRSRGYDRDQEKANYDGRNLSRRDNVENQERGRDTGRRERFQNDNNDSDYLDSRRPRTRN